MTLNMCYMLHSALGQFSPCLHDDANANSVAGTYISTVSSVENTVFFIFLMKLFRTNNIDTVKICQSQFRFDLPSSVIKNVP